MKQKQGLKAAAIGLLIIIALASVVFISEMTQALPEGAQIGTDVFNTTKASQSPGQRNDSKGYIMTMTLNTIQQNTRWKAYVGNVSGTLVLQDSDSYSIYEWPTASNPTGEVYITRNSTVDWATINCSNATGMGNEQSSLAHGASASDNINNTFSSTLHESFLVGTRTIVNSTCPSTATWINSTAQTLTQNSSTSFQEILLMDSAMRLVYTTLIEQNNPTYRDNDTQTFDFQAIVADYADSTPAATYYFYVEVD